MWEAQDINKSQKVIRNSQNLLIAHCLVDLFNVTSYEGTWISDELSDYEMLLLNHLGHLH